MSSTPKIFLWVINLFIFLAIMALMVTAYLTLARATIVLPGERIQFSNAATMEITDAQDSEISAQILSGEFESSDTFPVGDRASTADKAGGTVTIINEGSRNQTLVASTRLLTPDDVLFRISETVIVPTGGSVSVFAEADQAGDQSLIGPTSFTIPGLSASLQQLIYAESDAPMNYERFGTGTVSQEILDEAERVLTEKNIELARLEFSNRAPDSYLPTEHITAQRIELTAEPGLGSEADSIEVTLRSSVLGVAVNDDEMREAATSLLLASLPNPEAFIEIIPGSLSSAIVQHAPDGSTAELATEISAWIQSSDTPDSVDTKQLTGKSVADAEAYLTSNGIQGARIELFPAWLPALPLLADHIAIEVR